MIEFVIFVTVTAIAIVGAGAAIADWLIKRELRK